MLAEKEDSLLDTLTTQQIDDLIFEEKLREDGYQFYFAVDHYDISKYCFPIGIDSQDEEFTLDYLSDQFVTLIDFFETNKPLFLLDQYHDEFKGLHRTLVVKLFKSEEFVKTASTFSTYLNNDKEKNVLNDIGLMISIATGILKRGVSRFNSLISQNILVINDPDLDLSMDDSKDSEILEKAFFETRKIRQSKVDKIKRSIENVIRTRRRKNLETDCFAIDRICQINQLFIEQDADKVLFFLSSTKTSRNIHLIEDVIDYPLINGKRLNFNRNSAQLFLKLLLRNENNIIQQLQEIKKVIIKKNERLNFSMENSDFFKNRIKKLRNRYAHEKLLKDFDHYESLFTQLEESDLTKHKLKPLYKEIVKDFTKRGAKEIEEYSRELLDNLDFEYEFIINFEKWMDIAKKKNGKFLFSIQRGLDPVFGTGHHLPLVFINGGDQKELIAAITSRYIEDEVSIIVDREQQANSKIKEYVSTYVKKIQDMKGLWTEPEEVLVRCLLYLIIPSKRENVDLIPEKIVLKFINKEFLSLKENSSYKKELISDYYYLILWANRRSRLYKEAIEIGIEASKKFIKDPRFPHGLSLTYYCRFREFVSANVLEPPKSKEILDILDKALKHGEKAFKLYGIWSAYSMDTEVYEKNFSALKIALVLYYVYAFCYYRKFEDLKKARKLLNEVKENKRSAYPKQPEYGYVESNLEYREYTYYQEQGEVELAKKKLKQAKLAIGKVISIGLLRNEYSEWKKILDKI